MKVHHLFSVTFFFLFYSISVSAQKAYLSHGRTDATIGVTVLDLTKNSVLTEIPVDNAYPSWTSVSPDGSKVYAEFINTYTRVASILVIDTKTDKIVDTISTSSGVFKISSSGKKFYGVKTYSPGVLAIFVMDLQTKQIEYTIPLPVSTGYYNNIADIVLSRDETKLYAAESNTIQVVDLKTNVVAKTINITGGKYDSIYNNISSLAISPDGAKLYASEEVNDWVMVFNTSTDALITTVPAGGNESNPGPSKVIVSPDGARVYVNNYYSLSIGVIDAVNNMLLDTFVVTDSNINNIFLSPDGTRLFASDNFERSDILFTFNTADNSLVSKLRLSVSPDLLGDFVSTVAPDTAEGSFVASGSSIPAVNGNYFTSFQNAAGQKYAEINPNGSDLGAAAWGVNIGAGNDYENGYGWFGGSQKQNGMFLNRNLFITPSSQPVSASTVRIYCTNTELKNLIDSFNIRYGTSFSESDIRIVKYDGSHVDLDRTNNDDNGGAYSSIVPLHIGYYGFSNTYRYFEFPVSSFSEFYIALSVPNGVLPVTLFRFAAERKNNAVVLNWQTGAGQNFSKFDVDRSVDGVTFAKLVSVYANTNVQSVHNYSTVDYNPVFPKTFYRLRMIEKNGAYSYSDIVGIDLNANNQIVLYPNPVGKILTIQLTSAMRNRKQISFADITGKIVKVVPVSSDAITVTVDVSEFAKGVYTVIAGDVRKSFIKEK